MDRKEKMYRTKGGKSTSKLGMTETICRKLKNTLSNFQREVNSVTENIDIEKDLTDRENTQEKNNKTNTENE